MSGTREGYKSLHFTLSTDGQLWGLIELCDMPRVRNHAITPPTETREYSKPINHLDFEVVRNSSADMVRCLLCREPSR